MYYKIQTFNATSNRACSSLLLLAAIGIAIPTAGHQMMNHKDPQLEEHTLWISRGTAIILFSWCVVWG
jgi:Ca2+:H+ antiporter